MSVTGQAELAQSVQKLDQHVKGEWGALVLDAPEGVVSSIPADHLAELRTSLMKANLVAREDSEVKANVVDTKATWSGEHGYITSHWYGWELGMDPWLCGKVVGGVAGAGAVASCVGAAAGGGPAVIIAAGFSLIVAMVNLCKHENGWTYIYLIGAPPFTPSTVVCNPFG